MRDSDDEDDGTPRASSKKKKLAAAGGRGKGRVSTGKGKTAGGLEFQDGADVKQDNAFFSASRLHTPFIYPLLSPIAMRLIELRPRLRHLSLPQTP